MAASVLLVLLYLCLTYAATNNICLYSPATGTVLSPLRLYQSDCPDTTVDCMKQVYNWGNYQYNGPASLYPGAGEIFMFLSEDYNGVLDFTTFFHAKYTDDIVTHVQITGAALDVGIVVQDDLGDYGNWNKQWNNGTWWFQTKPEFTDGVVLGPIDFLQSYCLAASFENGVGTSLTSISIVTGNVTHPTRVATLPFHATTIFQFCQYPHTATNVTNNRCPGQSQGAASVRVTYGPTTGNLWKWTDASGNIISTSSSVSSLASGTYSVHLESQLAVGCTADLQVIISDPGTPTVSQITTTLSTTTQGGSASISVSHGSAPYSFQIVNSAGTTVSTTPTATNLPAGTYTVTVTDSCGNTVSQQFTITAAATASPTLAPTNAPTAIPSKAPTNSPTTAPSQAPTAQPTRAPTATPAPTAVPSDAPSAAPSAVPSKAPSAAPSQAPSAAPSQAPSAAPSQAPSAVPSAAPSQAPSAAPTATPAPTAVPSAAPSAAPSQAPSAAPSPAPSTPPSTAPTRAPTTAPSKAPSAAPSKTPTAAPSKAPSAAPTVAATASPTSSPSLAPTPTPTSLPDQCSGCPNKATLPVVNNIPGDNQCDPALTQTQILIELYNALGGSGWTNNANWGQGDPCVNQWYGITCNQNGAVEDIDLHSNNLVGNQIPPEIGCLPFLKGLVLDNNHIYGQLPNNFCKLINIIYLTLSHNNLGGTIPVCFSNLVNIQELYLNDNGLTGTLPNVTGYSTLKELVVSDNCLSGQIPQVLTSTVLIDLTFDNNRFQGCIPDSPYKKVGTFSGNLFCGGHFPCWLSNAQLGCPSTGVRTTQSGPFSYCSSLCLVTLS